jgi:type II restriction/modification system DNA methylase subunit YeeA
LPKRLRVESESKYEAEGLMDTSTLKKFAQEARRQLREQVCSKLELVHKEGSLARRESASSVEDLEEAIANTSKETVIDRVAYIWFNRLCALRFMDVNHYTKIKAVSSVEGFTQPEILAEAKQGHVDDSLENFVNKKKVLGILSGSEPSKDPEQEAYRLLLVANCNYYNHVMPFLFQKIDDYTELLIPADLLSESSILTSVRKAMTDETCQKVEVIGWLYQFYISEKKDEVFDGLKKNKKITPENIPAATQLFTPHWIVQYLVENSLGRLWMLNNPSSRLIEKMDYYIKPVETESDFLKVSKPDEIKVCDPACGSGHMLTYTFDLLYAIYEEEGYEGNEIPRLILENNLYGIEIDERAGELAAFALTMKAREKHKRFFSKAIQPNICVLENIQLEEGKLKEYMDFIGRDLFTAPLQTTLRQFEEADNFGSLIRPEVTDVTMILKTLEVKDVSGQLFLNPTHQKVLQVLLQADYLSPKYHVVVANPPYMGGKGMSGRLGTWLKDNYVDVKSDLFSAFIVRNTELALPKGQLGFMSPFVWMFISSYEKLRSFLINQKTITSLVQLEYSGFDGATVPICTFTIENAHYPELKGGYIRLSNFRGSENQAPKTLEAIRDQDSSWFYRASSTDFSKIPGSPIAYWISDKMRKLFIKCKSLADVGTPRLGMATGNNDIYVRNWPEVSIGNVSLGCKTRSQARESSKKWFPYNKGGPFRRWYGNNDNLVNWENDGEALQNTMHPSGSRIWAHNFNLNYILKPCLTFTATSSSYFGIRYSNEGFLFDNKGSSYFADTAKLLPILGFLASKPATQILKAINPTIEFQPGNISVLPFPEDVVSSSITRLISRIVEISKSDWDSYETSWDFTNLPLMQSDYRQPTLKAAYQKLRTHWKETMLELQRLEEENNRIFIEAYGLQDELMPEVSLSEITLTCNPHYRYGSEKTDERLKVLLLGDTMREFISYAVGCMLGRYSLDKPGVILANQGETIEDYIKQIPEPIFEADDDNVIPFLHKGFFTDDVTERFYKFLKVTFGEEHFNENLKFIEKSIGKDVRKYFFKDFYADHIKRYKKRPIYWMFSSPKGTFNALIYMHRYRPDTVSIVLNDYLREFRTKLTARKDHLDNVKVDGSANQREQTQAIKELETIKKQIDELNDYEHEILFPLATQKVEIDLDDGVKVNYPKFGKALQRIAGLSDAKKAKGAAL